MDESDRNAKGANPGSPPPRNMLSGQVLYPNLPLSPRTSHQHPILLARRPGPRPPSRGPRCGRVGEAPMAERLVNFSAARTSIVFRNLGIGRTRWQLTPSINISFQGNKTPDTRSFPGGGRAPEKEPSPPEVAVRRGRVQGGGAGAGVETKGIAVVYADGLQVTGTCRTHSRQPRGQCDGSSLAWTRCAPSRCARSFWPPGREGTLPSVQSLQGLGLPSVPDR